MMPNNALSPVAIERATEQLRQERETFNQAKTHEGRWFILRLVMGYSSVVLLGAVMVVASYIIFNSSSFPAGVVTTAGAALFVDVLGLLISVWKIALNPDFNAKLSPVTREEIPPISPQAAPSQTVIDD